MQLCEKTNMVSYVVTNVAKTFELIGEKDNAQPGLNNEKQQKLSLTRIFFTFL